MKLSEFDLLDEGEEEALLERLRGLNQTTTAYPRDLTAHRVFSEQAARNPEQTAVIYEGTRLTYGELERRSNVLAHFLVQRGIRPEEPVAVMLDRSPAMIVALLGILKAGAAYVPISHDLPFERLKYILADTRARFLISEKQYIKSLNRLQWECRELQAFLCLDSRDVHGEIEEQGGMMEPEMWEHVARETFDDISGGGWKSSYTGEWLSREVMDEYGENIRRKLEPLLNEQSRVLEIGCASGISMFRLAPLVGRYYGTDLSRGIIAWAGREAAGRGLDQVRLAALAAHEIDQIDEHEFDVVIINSVIECFSGHNYLRQVLRKAIALMPDDGYLFLGNVWDQDLKQEFVNSLLEFKRQHPNQGYRTKTDRADELYLSRTFLEDLRCDLPEIAEIEYSGMLGSAESELSRFGFDALIRIEKRRTRRLHSSRVKYQFDQQALAGLPEAPLPERTGPQGLAYLMYTSGTSGQPKGVMIEHRSILRLVLETNYIRLGPDDRTLQTGALGFDASTFEIWGPLLNGGGVVLPPGKSFLDVRDLARMIRADRITTLFLTTGLFNQVVEIDLHVFDELKVLLTGGEKVSVQHFNRVRERHPGLSLKHVYGPTENTTFSTCYEVTNRHERDVPIGRPISNTTAYILDENGKPAPPGVPGELCVGGDGLSRGYLNDPELTNRKFIPHPFEPGARLYRTGDLARWSPEDEIEFIGRIDTQVKVRGYRIELEEIESCLLRHEAVREAAVITADLGGDGSELVAYVAAEKAAGDQEPSLNELRGYVKSALPEYMVPAHWVRLEKLPLNANGKIDRRALPAPSVAKAAGTEADRPATPLEQQLAAIWERVLGQREISATADFFDLGGHSLKVTRLVSLIQQEMGVEVPITIVFRTPTIRDLAGYLSDLSQLAPLDRRLIDEKLVLLNEGSGARLFAFPPGSGYCLSYLRMARLLPYAFHGFSFIEDETRLQQYVELLRETDPVGPYVFFGYSAGGKLAFQVAQELERTGGPEVSDIIMMDSARYLRRILFSETEIHEVAAEFLQSIQSRALRESALARIRRYRDFIGESVESGTVRADLHLIVAPDSQAIICDHQGSLLATLPGWKDLTTGRFQSYEGDGTHREMLNSPHLERNVELLKKILAEVPNKKEAHAHSIHTPPLSSGAMS